MKNHKHYKFCIQANSGISFSPEKRAVSDLEYYDQKIKELEEKNIDIQKFDSLFVDWQRARSKCMSPMITGPARFPVERNKKNFDAEQKKYEMMVSYLNRCFAPQKTKRLTGQSEIDRLKEKLQKLEIVKEQLKKAKKEAPETLHGYSIDYASRDIRETKKRIEYLNKMLVKNSAEYEMQGVRIIEVYEENRIRLFFEGKPSPEIISRLKKCAFRWTPSIMAWQGYLSQKNRLNFIFGE